MSVIASPVQQGPAPPNTQTRIHNNTLKVASVGGGQNAVYHVVGGAITDNVNLNLPPLTADDTVATLNQNNNWTGVHTFGAGLTSNGPITTTAGINANGPITTNDAIVAAGGITSVGPFTAQGNFNAANLITPGSLQVGTTATITGTINPITTTTTGVLASGNHTVTGTHTVSGTSTLNGQAIVNNQLQAQSHYVTGTGGLTIQHASGFFNHIGNSSTFGPSNLAYTNGMFGHINFANNIGGFDHDYFGLGIGATKGTIFGTAVASCLAFHGGSTTGSGVKTNAQWPSTFGGVFAGMSYTGTEQSMLNNAYACLRAHGLLT